jgi:hypothetical protein
VREHGWGVVGVAVFLNGGRGWVGWSKSSIMSSTASADVVSAVCDVDPLASFGR